MNISKLEALAERIFRETSRWHESFHAIQTVGKEAKTNFMDDLAAVVMLITNFHKMEPAWAVLSRVSTPYLL
jgi:hypothetical protein